MRRSGDEEEDGSVGSGDGDEEQDEEGTFSGDENDGELFRPFNNYPVRFSGMINRGQMYPLGVLPVLYSKKILTRTPTDAR